MRVDNGKYQNCNQTQSTIYCHFTTTIADWSYYNMKEECMMYSCIWVYVDTMSVWCLFISTIIQISKVNYGKYTNNNNFIDIGYLLILIFEQLNNQKMDCGYFS